MLKSQVLPIFLLALISSSWSRLIFPNTIEEKYPESFTDKIKAGFVPKSTNSGSSANPVQGIANATSGYLTVNDPEAESKLFYVFYECRNRSSSQSEASIPVLIWLQGGPGESSLFGQFYETGPWKLELNTNGAYQEVPRHTSWNDYYHILYIDSPRGTGYSIAGNNSYVTNETQVAQDFLQALNQFYQLQPFTKFASTPLYITGESYAGHYIPAIASAIIAYNQNAQTQIPLQGIAIGNPWVDPINQIQEFSLFAYVLGLADDIQRSFMEYLQLDAHFSLLNNNPSQALADVAHLVNFTQTIGGGLNEFDYRDFGSYNFTAISTFMNYQSTCTRYNVDPSVCGNFVLINPNVNKALLGDFMNSYASDFANVLDSGLRALVYVGQDDILVNSANSQDWIGRLNWAGNSQYYYSSMEPWIMNNGSVVGLAKSAANMTYVIVNKAGHMSPMQQIESTTEMIVRYVSNFKNWTAPIPNVI